MLRIIPRLSPVESDALLIAARQDRRDPRDLAAIFIVEKLERLGFLDPSATSTSMEAAQCSSH